MSEDPRKDLRKLGDTGPLPMSERAIDEATPAQAQVMLMIHDLRTSNDRQFGTVFKKVDEAAAHAIDAKLEAANLRTDIVHVQSSIRDVASLQKIANGSVDTLKAKMRMIESDRKISDASITSTVIAGHVQAASEKGVWIIPKPTWKQWTALGCVIAFFGVDRMMVFFQWIGLILSRIH